MLGLPREVVGIEMCDVFLLLWLIPVYIESFLVQNMLGDIVPDFIMNTEGIEMLQCLRKASKVVVDFKMTPSLGQLLQLPKERKVFSRILEGS